MDVGSRVEGCGFSILPDNICPTTCICRPAPELQPVEGQPGEERLPAHASHLQQGHRCCSVLAAPGGAAIWGAEHLLATLEACGVDNARIEIEGGRGEQA
jgi:hypothetical protein